MSISHFEGQLSHIEAQLALLSEALLRNDANGVVAASHEVQSLAVLFSQALPQVAASLKGNPAAQLRVRKIAATLGSMREGLLRHSVAVDRALAALVPATKNDTYSPKSGAYARNPYGSAGRQSGEFRGVAA